MRTFSLTNVSLSLSSIPKEELVRLQRAISEEISTRHVLVCAIKDWKWYFTNIVTKESRQGAIQNYLLLFDADYAEAETAVDSFISDPNPPTAKEK